jgi:hypothetical protein
VADDAGESAPCGESRERLSILGDELRDARIRIHRGEGIEIVDRERTENQPLRFEHRAHVRESTADRRSYSRVRHDAPAAPEWEMLVRLKPDPTYK